MIRRRDPRKDDITIRRIVIKELVPYSQANFPPSELGQRAITRRLNRNVTFVFAEKGRLPIGFISFRVNNQILNIDMIALETRYQGRGLGGKLMDIAEGYGKTKKCRESWLIVDESNLGAQRFYLQKGYTATEYISMVRCYRLSKPL